MKVGVLALQGDVPEHRAAVARVVGPRHTLLVRTPLDLARVDALVLPGGESTTIAALLQETGLWTALEQRLRRGFPVLGTCAGLILLAREIDPSPGGHDPPSLRALDVRVIRNEYGTQRESFEADVEVEGLSGRPFPGVFIRAPRIHSVGKAARVLARHGSEVVGVQEGRVMGIAFHPELSRDPRLLKLFLAAAQRPASPRRRSATAAAKRSPPARAAHR